MAATALSRTAYNLLVEDDGSGLTGSVWDKADVDDLMDAVDAVFSTLGTVTFESGGSGGNIVKVANTTAGTTNFAAFRLGTDGAVVGQIALRTSTYTTAGGLRANGMDIYSDGAGGVNVIAAEASNGYIRFYTAGTADANLRGYFDPSGVFFLKGGTLLATAAALTNGAAAQVATMTNGPTAGNPTKWIPIVDNGTTRYFPAW